MRLDPDIQAAMEEIQRLREEGKLEGVRQITLHCNDQDHIQVVQVEANLRRRLAES